MTLFGKASKQRGQLLPREGEWPGWPPSWEEVARDSSNLRCGMLPGVLSLIAVAVFGLALATLLMWVCARLAGVESVTLRASILAACGFGLPLSAALKVVVAVPGSWLGLLLVLAAVAVGLVLIRAAYGTTWGKAALTWFLHLCVWVLFSSLMIRFRS
jgi:hypothetical protein